MATQHVRIGLGVLNPHQHHPTLMAMEIAAFDELSEGRAVLGEAPEDAIDDELLAEYAIAGTPEQCLAQAEVYARAGVTELLIAPIGERPAADIARLGRALK